MRGSFVDDGWAWLRTSTGQRRRRFFGSGTGRGRLRPDLLDRRPRGLVSEPRAVRADCGRDGRLAGPERLRRIAREGSWTRRDRCNPHCCDPRSLRPNRAASSDARVAERALVRNEEGLLAVGQLEIDGNSAATISRGTVAAQTRRKSRKRRGSTLRSVTSLFPKLPNCIRPVDQL